MRRRLKAPAFGGVSACGTGTLSRGLVARLGERGLGDSACLCTSSRSACSVAAILLGPRADFGATGDLIDLARASTACIAADKSGKGAVCAMDCRADKGGGGSGLT
mmetsp:Transcript_47363/g.112609  ORF Transcript_47363/g.112609 Transcript_47363/m.112609 type:complete len:106 (+) Transcript_47363:711-1028(+)